MTRTISTPEELNALPVGSVVRTQRGWLAERVTTSMPQCWRVSEDWRSGHYPPVRLIDLGPLTVLHDPSAPSVPAPDPDDRETLGRLLWAQRGGSLSGGASWDDPELFVEHVKESWRREADKILAAGFRSLTVTPELIEAGAKALYEREPWQDGSRLNGVHAWEGLHPEDHEQFRTQARAVLEAALGDTK